MKEQVKKLEDNEFLGTVVEEASEYDASLYQKDEGEHAEVHAEDM